MTRVPKPSYEYNMSAMSAKWRPDIAPADYSDEVTDADLDALRKISSREVDLDDLQLVDGPAW